MSQSALWRRLAEGGDAAGTRAGCLRASLGVSSGARSAPADHRPPIAPASATDDRPSQSVRWGDALGKVPLRSRLPFSNSRPLSPYFSAVNSGIRFVPLLSRWPRVQVPPSPLFPVGNGAPLGGAVANGFGAAFAPGYRCIPLDTAACPVRDSVCQTFPGSSAPSAPRGELLTRK